MASPRSEEEAVKSFIQVSSARSGLPLVSFPTPSLHWDPCPGCARTSQDGSQNEGFWEEQESFWPGVTP